MITTITSRQRLAAWESDAMSTKPVGRLNQIAYMVPDLDAAIDWWTQVMGVGPFFVFPGFDMVRSDYRGMNHKVEFGAAVTYSGDLMVELIEPRGPSIFQEFLADGRTGIHHLCAFADSMEETQAWVESKGGKRLQGAAFADGSEIAYFAMNENESVILEVGVLKPEVVGLFDAIQAAAADWDGETKLFDPTAK
jgi:catechol 2,3-dioxygenase-like lactoylglutathione lyase family enzyme